MTLRPILNVAALCIAFSSVPAVGQHATSAFLSAFDTNRDGRLTRAEYDTARGARFAASDANHDGWLSEDEYVAEYSGRLEQQLASFDRDETKKTEERQRQVRQAHVRFGVLDADEDKRMTRAEYDVVGARSFVEQDVDGDGVVTATDVAAAAARRVAIK